MTRIITALIILYLLQLIIVIVDVMTGTITSKKELYISLIPGSFYLMFVVGVLVLLLGIPILAIHRFIEKCKALK